jgi:hypothetical protein
MVLEHAETRIFAIDTVVTWDAPHFKGKTHLNVLTPTEYLRSAR